MELQIYTVTDGRYTPTGGGEIHAIAIKAGDKFAEHDADELFEEALWEERT